ncbi:hypothetical protein ACILPE_03320 [Capnocytophaga canimorsus]|uniref:hypothetical protein n=1 Tax=Capnocytophaga canimorsus TaxID=28188 RepID=UPI001561B5C5|nr:hypothetical protein [Capnocytophaga canimorsus]
MIKLIHSYWAYLTLIVLVVAVINAIIGFFSKKEYKSGDLRIGLFALIVSHIQFLLGLILYFVSPLFALWSEAGAKTIMKDSYLRKMLVEHPSMILIAITLITIGWSLHKKQKTSQGAFGKIAFFYALALLLILFVIPWNVWI